MRNFMWTFLMFFYAVSFSFSQTKSIEKGTYIGRDERRIKLNLLEDNKCELIISSVGHKFIYYIGEYIIKGDSLSFVQTEKNNYFHLTFKNDKTAKKVKIKYQNSYSDTSFYIGTQNNSESVHYQKISDIITQIYSEEVPIKVGFEIDRTDYLYLVHESHHAETEISKYALPKDVSEVTIEYEFDGFDFRDNLNLGFFDKKTGELRIFGQGKDVVVFLNVKDVPPSEILQVTAIENKAVSNWTYPGKDSSINQEDFEDVTDTTTSKFNFKFKIENSLKAAIAATKSAKNKFLVVAIDNKNISEKADFDSFIKNQEIEVGNDMYDGYNSVYDLYNFYLAIPDDRKWFKNSKISDSPCLIVLNNNEDILATAKSNITQKKNQFNNDNGLYRKLLRIDGLLVFDQTLKNKKATDAEVVFAFNKMTTVDEPDEDVYGKRAGDFEMVDVVLDKKEVAQIWEKLLETHQKDIQPNRALVETILKEIKKEGFYKMIFNENRVLNDTDYLAIDYLLKHYDAIEKMNAEDKKEDTPPLFRRDLSSEISGALLRDSLDSGDGVIAAKANQKKINALYNKLIIAGKGYFDCYRNYFEYLNSESYSSIDDTEYLNVFKSYFDNYLATWKGNPEKRLENMFLALDSDSEYKYELDFFKQFHISLANSSAWLVVKNPENSRFIKDAILWSEYSSAVTENKVYHFNTLAQLYYIDGEKQRAITTQELAVKLLNDDVDKKTANEIRETLTKMQNGSY
ncbi:hypothetical protein CLU81_0499 [Flavobacterium sp. 9]|uniref:hypothetical protein n=1 Tax=Flavobacterium sp. 9 TaxID=2035198 RepID=UPI000C180561|nr:hypothetical protein [Flavobacterium sp. 9]PIF30098.1 hypothetical protein CLU81_0499 [Flavobacterium sp. 9]